MILDAQNQLSDAQSLASGASSGIVSTNSLDLGDSSAKRGFGGLGVGELLKALINVTTALNHGGSATAVNVDLIQADNAALTSNVEVLERLGSFTPTAAAGTQIKAALDTIHPTKRYVGFRYTSVGADLNAGAVDGFFAKDVDAFKAFQDNVVIS